MLFALLLASPLRFSGAAEPAAEEARFAIMEYRVLGNTVLPATDIERTLYPLLGPDKNIQDVEQARQLLETLYRDRGYGAVYADIPEQGVESGIVRLRITEGRLDRVRVTGSRYFSNGRIRAEIPALQAGEVLNLPELQLQLADSARQTRDRAITPVLKAGRKPGAVDVELRVQDELPLHGGVEYNNRYSANTTHTRASFNLGYDNLFQRYHSLGLQYQTSPEDLDETRVLAATYIARLQRSRMLAVYAVDTNSDFAVVNTGGDLAVLGAGTIVGTRYILPLTVPGTAAHSLTLGADYKDFEDNIVLPDGTRDTTPIRYLALTSAYGHSRALGKGSAGFNIGVTAGLRPLIADPAQFAYKRVSGKPNFLYLRADATAARPLWRGGEARLRFGGQWSPDTLISNEQFATGGSDGVRGYLESTLLADRGLTASAEYLSPDLLGVLGLAAGQLRVLGFLDFARMRQLDQRIHEGTAYDVLTTLMSAGTGARLQLFSGLEASADWAWPLRSLGETARGDSHLHFRIRYSF